MYYSLFGARGVFLGAKARFLRRPIEVAVKAPGVAHPVCLRLRTTDVALCREVLVDGQHNWGFPKSPRVIVDAGANIGLTAVFYANKYPQAKLIAVEPEPSNYAMLVKNTAPYPNVVPVHAALWMENRELNLFDPGEGHTAFQTRGVNGAPTVEVQNRIPGVTLDRLMAEFSAPYIDLLKVDIEGSEIEVFEHASSWIGAVGVIAVEFHDWIRAGCSQSVRRATRDFEFEWHKGATTYLARKEYASNNASDQQTSMGLQNSATRKITPKFPLEILHTL